MRRMGIKALSPFQVILALSTYGIDCNKDERFQKKEKGLS